MSALARLLVPVDLSEVSIPALDYACAMRTRWASVVDVYYLWAGDSDPGGADPLDVEHRALRELEVFSRDASAWGVFDHLSRLERAGLVSVSGYLTPRSSGRTLAVLGATCGYDLVVLGTRQELAAQRFELHGIHSSRTSRSRWCPVLTMEDRAPALTGR